MSKSAAAIRELVERWMGKKHPITMQSYVSDLTALISEHYYPKEFTEWVAKMIDIGDLWESQIEKGWILLPDPKGVQKRFKTTDELYQYYKENEQ